MLQFINVERVRVVDSPVRRELMARVALDERRVARVGSPVDGRVVELLVVVGDGISAGAPLLTVRSPDLVAARSDLTKAVVHRRTAELAAERARRLVREGAGSEAERLEAEEALARAREDEERTRVALASLGGRGRDGRYRLESPISGTVVAVTAAVGAEVHPDQGEPLVTVSDLSSVWILADVYESDLASVHTGDEVSVTLDGLPDRTFTATIAHVGDIVEPSTLSTHARIELRNPDRAMRPGMFARVTVTSARAAHVQVPAAAVLARRDQQFVFVRDADGAFSQRVVEIGTRSEQRVVVTKGLADGEYVVTGGAILLDVEANAAL